MPSQGSKIPQAKKQTNIQLVEVTRVGPHEGGFSVIKRRDLQSWPPLSLTLSTRMEERPMKAEPEGALYRPGRELFQDENWPAPRS